MSAPKIDRRSNEDILNEIRKLAPFYTPEWNPDSGDAGFALSRIFARMFEGIIGRLNRVPDKNFIEFLNMLGTKLLPAQQARAPVVFSLSQGVPEPVLIPAGTQVAANPADGGEPVVFETERTVLATPAELADVFCVRPDEICQAPPELLSGEGEAPEFKMFAGQNLQEHILYFGHSDLLNAANQVEIELVSSSWNPLFRNPGMVKWEYYGEQEKWIELDVDERETGGTPALVLKKKQAGEIKETGVNGENSRWIRCRANNSQISSLKDVSLGAVKMTVKPLKVREGIPEKAYYDPEEKAFYIGDNMLFNINDRVGIELSFIDWRPKLDDPEMFRWQYYGKRSGTPKWYDLKTANCTAGKVMLNKDKLDEITEYPVNGVNSRWIRCLINTKGMKSFQDLFKLLDLALRPEIGRELTVLSRVFKKPEKVVLDKGRIVLDYGDFTADLWKAVADQVSKKLKKVRVSVEENPCIPPDLLFHNDIPLEMPAAGKPVYPFGKLPRTFDVFYLGCSDALSKKGGTVTLDVDVSSGGLSIPVGLVQGIGPDFVAQLLSHKGADGAPEPIDTVDKLLSKTPRELAGILSITTKDKQEKPITVTKALNLLEAAQKAYYDKTGIYRAVNDPAAGEPAGDSPSAAEAGNLMLSWEYWDGKGWKALSGLTDNTNKLRQKGTIVFTCPEDLAAVKVNGEETLWIRVRIISGDYGKERFISPDGKTWETDTSQICPPTLYDLRIRYSAVPLYPEKRLTYNNLDFADTALGLPGQTGVIKPFRPLDDHHCTLYLGFSTPPLKGPISLFFLLEETGYLEENRPRIEWQYYREEKGKGEWARLEVMDGTAGLTESGVLEFIGPPDYARNKRFGRKLCWIRAVDAEDKYIKGKIPAPAPVIRGIYLNAAWTRQVLQTETDSGARGNVGAYEITELKTSIAFVNGVYNPEAADGGSDREEVQQALERGPQLIRHQNRAVTLEDFEWLAREASRNIVRVKCLPNLNDKDEFGTGWVTLVIAPESIKDKPVPSLRLRQQVKKYLAQRTANIVAFPSHVRVIGPSYREISVHTTIAARDITDVPYIENRAMKQLAAHLHPLTGGDMGRGWEFGRFPYLSDFYALLEDIEGVDHVDSLAMVIKDDNGNELTVDSKHPLSTDIIKHSPYSLVYSGKHVVNVKAAGGIL